MMTYYKTTKQREDKEQSHLKKKLGNLKRLFPGPIS